MTNFLARLFTIDIHGDPYGWETLVKLTIVIFLVSALRSFLVAGPAYVVFWKWLRKRLHHRRIQEKFPKAFRLWNEFKWSMSTMVVYTVLGLLFYVLYRQGLMRNYGEIEEYGWAYYVFSIFLMIVVHDAYFYWTHRLLHWKPLFRRVHRIHHESINPSPWSAFSFHPIEAAISFGIIPLIVFTMPFHVSAVKWFLVYMTVLNVLGHLGYETFPRGFTRHWLTWWHNTSTHHNIHHRRVHCNFSLYLNVWDRMMGTNYAHYHETYEQVTSAPLLARAESVASTAAKRERESSAPIA